MKANILSKRILWKKWGEYAEYTIEYFKENGENETQVREIQDSGNGAAILLYNLEKRSIILIKQFRLATMINGNADGMMVECCAGLIEDETALETIKREVQEETGYEIMEAEYLFDAYATPGAKTEKISFFVAPYSSKMKISEGGGHLLEQEEIEVLEIEFSQAIQWWKEGKICDAKTIILLQHAQMHLFHQ